MRTTVPALAAGFVLAAAGAASGQGTITNGNADWAFNNSATRGSANFRPDGTTDHVFQNWWYWRVNGVSTQENNFGWFPSSQVYAGNVATVGGTEFNGRLDWELQITLNDLAPPAQAIVFQTMRLTNTSTVPLDLAIFNYLDADVGGTAGGDSAVLTGADAMTVTDGGGDFVYFQGVGANRWQAAPFATLRTQLENNSVENLTNAGLPFGPGDWTGAFQWDIVINPGQSVVLREIIGVNVIPAPGVAGVLGLAGVLALRRRR